jgi:hypothetical protein
MQHLMDIISRFQNWNGIKVNMKKTSIMVVHGVIPWTEENLSKISQKWTQVYKSTWDLPRSTDSLPFTGPTEEDLERGKQD